MPRDPILSSDIRRKLIPFEMELQNCVRNADFEKSKKIAGKIQLLLKSKGYTSRLIQNKNVFFEVALEADAIEYAISGFLGNRRKVSSSSRIYLEATALLSICYIRKGDLKSARFYTQQTLAKINNIKSDYKRRKFQKIYTNRIEDEIALYSIKADNSVLSVDQVHNQSITLIREKTEEQIFKMIGEAIPDNAIEQLSYFQKYTLSLIPPDDRKSLPEPVNISEKMKIGKKFSAAIKRVAWKSLCDPHSEVYKAWSQGLSIVHDQKWITVAVVAAFTKRSIGISMLAASAVAIAVRFGVDLFCETFMPDDIMELRKK